MEVCLARLDERIKAMREDIRRTEESGERALDLATQELHRRLEILNGEAGRLREMQATYVPREIFDRYKETQETRISGLENFNANLTGKQWIGGAVIVILAAAITFGVNFLKH
jgi:hypothetical protein